MRFKRRFAGEYDLVPDKGGLYESGYLSKRQATNGGYRWLFHYVIQGWHGCETFESYREAKRLIMEKNSCK